MIVYALNYRNHPTDMQICKRTHTRKKITASDFETDTIPHHIFYYTLLHILYETNMIFGNGGAGPFCAFDCFPGSLSILQDPRYVPFLFKQSLSAP